MTLRIGKQHELPRRPGDWTSAKGKMNQVEDVAVVEAEKMKELLGDAPAAPPTSDAAKKDAE